MEISFSFIIELFKWRIKVLASTSHVTFHICLSYNAHIYFMLCNNAFKIKYGVDNIIYYEENNNIIIEGWLPGLSKRVLCQIRLFFFKYYQCTWSVLNPSNKIMIPRRFRVNVLHPYITSLPSDNGWRKYAV